MINKSDSRALVIDGWGGSGKSVLLALLDSHDNILANPVHDKLFYSLSNVDEINNKDKIKDIRQLRECIVKSGYYNIEYNSNRGKIPVLLSSKKDDLIDVPFSFNFMRFEEKWTKEVIQHGFQSPSELFTIIYKHFFQLCLGETTQKRHTKYYATMGDMSQSIKKIFEGLPETRVIYVKRDVRDIIGIRCNRQTPSGMVSGMFEKKFKDILLRAEIQRIFEYESQIENLPNNLKSRVLIVDFHKLLSQTHKVMVEISEFLEIDYKASMLEPTMLGSRLVKNGKSYADTPNDNYEQLLTTKEIKIINILIKISKNSKLFRIMSIFAFHILSNLKRLIKNVI